MSDTILSPLIVRKTCLLHASKPEPTIFGTGKFGATIGQLNAAVRQLDQSANDITAENRRLVLGFIFTPDDQPFAPTHASDLTPQQKNALHRWVGSVHDADTDNWLPRLTFKAEANWILSVAQVLAVTAAANGGKLHMGTLLHGYATEIAAIGDLDTPEYWLAQAQGLEPSAIYSAERKAEEYAE